MGKTLKVAVAGLGTVGCGVVKNIAEKKDIFLARTNTNIIVTDISSRTKTGRSFDISLYKWHDSPLDLIKTDVDIIVETIGGEAGIAYDLIKGALLAKKHVVTANKALLAHHGFELAKLAEENNVSLNYEAAVAGGIPVIKALREGLASNHHTRVYGILNGTCNYILSEMEMTGGAFADILKTAQDLGYAEADPTLDVGGFDAAHKLTILSALAFGVQIDYKATSVEGIDKISDIDMDYAKKLGYRIRLLGIATRIGEQVLQRVHPVMIPPQSPAYAVGGSYNAVVIQSDYADDTVLVGRGAGEKPTASAVVADILDIARGIKLPVFGIETSKLQKCNFADLSQRTGRYYIRLSLVDKAGSIAGITSILAEKGISVQSFMQEDKDENGSRTVIIITHETVEKTVNDALEKISTSQHSASIPTMIRIMHP